MFTLQHLGFAACVCDWVALYLTDCSVQIQLDNHTCNPLQLQPVGIPQGSPLSLILSSIYSLPLLYLHTNSTHISICAYVDNFSILAIGNSYEDNVIELRDTALDASNCPCKLGLKFVKPNNRSISAMAWGPHTAPN
jgi:hypothetical protein